MRMTQGWTGLRTAVIALGIIAWTTTGVKADAMLSYSTAGAIGAPTGLTGANVISFDQAQAIGSPLPSVDINSNLTLGSFVVGTPAAGTTSTYDQTPFNITFIPATYNGTPVSEQNAVTISGFLNGSVTASQSTVAYTVTNVTGSFVLNGGAASTISIPYPTQLLVPSSDGGATPVQGFVTGSPGPESGVPEPSTVALFLSTIGGLGLRRFVLNRRQRRQA
jgi:hypothetical protein